MSSTATTSGCRASSVPQVALLEVEPDAGLAHAEFEAFNSETGAPVPWEREWDEDGDQLVELVRVGCFIMTGTVLIRRAAIDTRGLGFVNPGYASYDDYLLYLTIALDWRIAHEDRVVMRYRRHAGEPDEHPVRARISPALGRTCSSCSYAASRRLGRASGVSYAGRWRSS